MSEEVNPRSIDWDNDSEQFRIQDPILFRTDLPVELKTASNIVLLVDTTLNDDHEKIITPEPTVVGQILRHNISDYSYSIPYEQTSQYFIDNAHKFDHKCLPVVTLQFKLGLYDNGESMVDLLLKMNLCRRLQKFKFKVYICKSLENGKPNNFKLPPIQFFQNLKCVIGFRFETDHFVSKIDLEYHQVVEYFLPINISWLGDELEELHIGEKVRVFGDVSRLYFPKLMTVGFESKDLISSYNWAYVLNNHSSIIKNLTLREFVSPLYDCTAMEDLETVTILGTFTVPLEVLCFYGTRVKTLNILRRTLMDTRMLPFFTSVKELNLSRDPGYEPEYATGCINEFLEALSENETIVVTEVPFKPSYNYVNIKREAFNDNLRLYGLLTDLTIPSYLKLSDDEELGDFLKEIVLVRQQILNPEPEPEPDTDSDSDSDSESGYNINDEYNADFADDTDDE